MPESCQRQNRLDAVALENPPLWIVSDMLRFESAPAGRTALARQVDNMLRNQGLRPRNKHDSKQSRCSLVDGEKRIEISPAEFEAARKDRDELSKQLEIECWPSPGFLDQRVRDGA